MAPDYLEHITEAGERWDLIAFDYYGDATLLKPLFEANPELLSDPVTPAPLIFPRGVTVRVPLLDEADATAVQLPIWKRT